MTIEDRVKALILEKYETMKDFSKRTGIPQSTLVGILSRGLKNSNAGSVLTIARALGISADELAADRITPVGSETVRKPVTDVRDLLAFVKVQCTVYNALTIDGEPLTQEDIEIVTASLDIVTGILSKRHGKGGGR